MHCLRLSSHQYHLLSSTPVRSTSSIPSTPLTTLSPLTSTTLLARLAHTVANIRTNLSTNRRICSFMGPPPSKQATLGRFFTSSSSSGTTSSNVSSGPRQTTLSFSTKAKKVAAPEKDLPERGSPAEKKETDKHQKTEKTDENGDESSTIVTSSESPRKRTKRSRSRSPAHSTEPESSTAEKRIKREPATKSDVEDSSPSPKRRKKTRRGVIEEESDAEGEADAPKAPSATEATSAETPSTPKKRASPKPSSPKSSSPKGKSGERASMKTTSQNKSSKDDESKSESPKRARTKSASPKPSSPSRVKKEEEEVDPVSESESASDADDIEPSVVAKARKAVLQKGSKVQREDAYPDWEKGQPVPYAALCQTFSLIEMTSKRLTIMEYCSLFLRQVLRLTPEDLLATVMLMINKLAPDYAGIELGIGESLIMKAIGETTGRSLAVVKQDHKEVGDLGLVAVKSRSTQRTMFKPKPLTVRKVLDGLKEIATVTGTGAQGRKVDLIKKLIASADANLSGKVDITKDKGGPSEAKFIVRFLEGKLRLGLAERTVIVSLAEAVVCHEAEARGEEATTTDMEAAERILKTVYSELPSYEVIIPAMLEKGILHLHDHCKLQPGVPLKPMLAKPTKAITEVLDRFTDQTFTCEYKYDGERAQIHYVAKEAREKTSLAAGPGGTTSSSSSSGGGGGVTAVEVGGRGVAAIFSRNSEDLSKKYPDILAKLPSWVKPGTQSFVLDCETVAWDATEKKVLPFQQLMTRKKKDVKIEDVRIKVCVFAFDLLYLNGEAVVRKSLRERRALLLDAFEPVEGEFAFATHMDGRELDEIQTFLDESVKASCEGLMVKMLDGTDSGYEPSRRSRNWLKIKKDYLAGIGDSLDLVVLGAYFGKGKRTSVYGAFLLACYNPSTESYESVCNIGTGFSEQVLEELHASLSEITIDTPKPYYHHSSGGQHQPDVWFEPRFVWEVRTADLTLSPRYKAGIRENVDPAGEKGISLRFPRFIQIRSDKKPDEATTSRQVAEMYRKQESVARKPAVDDDFEY